MNRVMLAEINLSRVKFSIIMREERSGKIRLDEIKRNE